MRFGPLKLAPFSITHFNFDHLFKLAKVLKFES